MLNAGELRELIREEIDAAFSKHFKFGGSKDRLTPNLTSVTNPYLTVKEAAELTRLAASTIRLYIRKGQLKVQKVGRRVILSRAEIEKFVNCSNKVVDLFPT